MIGLRLRLRDGPPLLATFVILPRPEIVEIAAEAGFEAVILDREHGSLGDGDLSGMVAAASGAGLHTIVRVQECRSKLVEAALDAGADGVLVPHVSSAAAATAAVDAARFAPEGRRGVNPYVRAARYGADPGAFLDHANERAACIAMIEGPAGLQAAGEIVATTGLDAVFVGPFDLSAALGRTGEVDHPLVVEAVLEVHELAAASGVATGVFAPTPEAARDWLDRGLQLVALSVDTRLVLDGMRRAVAATRTVT